MRVVGSLLLLALTACWSSEDVRGPSRGSVEWESARITLAGSVALGGGTGAEGLSGHLAWQGEVLLVQDLRRAPLRGTLQLRTAGARFEMQGQEIPVDSDFGEGLVQFEVDTAEGVRLRFPMNSSIVFQNVVGAIAGQGVLGRPPSTDAHRGSKSMRDAYGVAKIRWSQADEGRWRRTLLGYEALHEGLDILSQEASGGCDLTYDADGLLRSVAGESSFRSQTAEGPRIRQVTLRLERTELERDSASFEALEEAVALGELQMDLATERMLLSQRAQGITADEVIGYARLFATIGKTKRHNSMFHRSVALVQLEPQVAQQVADAALMPETTPVSLGYLLDVLVSAQSAPAQEQILRILDAPKVQRAPELVRAGSFFRLGYVVLPVAQVVERGRVEYEANRLADNELGETMRLAYGSLMSRGSVRPEIREEGLERLMEGTSKEHPSRIRRDHVLALSNAGGEAALDHLVGLRNDLDPVVRGAVGTAMNAFEQARREVVLRDLLLDDAGSVQAAALRSWRDPSPQAAQMILEAVERDEIESMNLALVHQVLAPSRPSALARFFDLIEDRSDLEPALRARLREFRASQQAP